MARLISSFGKYAYGENEDTVFCHLYADGEINFENGLKLLCETNYPYEFEVSYKVLEGSKKLALRIPNWSSEYDLTINGEAVTYQSIEGYVYLDVTKEDVIKLTLNDKPYFVYASSKVPQLTGKAAICRGPLVYCFEGIDNEGDVLSLSLKTQGEISVGKWDEALLGGTMPIVVEAFKVDSVDSLYTMQMPIQVDYKAVAVPYYTWGNREENQMRVWMNIR